MVRDAVLCMILLLQLLSTGLCYPRVGIHGDRKLELPQRQALSHAADRANVLRANLLHRDTLDTSTKSASERFLNAVKRSHSRVQKMTAAARAVNLESGAKLSSPVSVGSGEYVMEFALGTPAQRFTTIVDTGSDLCWVQCAPCTRCFQQQDAVFNPMASSTYSLANCTEALCTALPRPVCGPRNTCTYAYAYGDGSYTRGNLASDTVTLDSSISHIGFGCGHFQMGSFAGSDGLIGLGQGPLSLPSQLSPAIAKIFSYCLVDQSTSSSSSPITFGDAAENVDASYTPLLRNEANPTYYYVGVTGVTVGTVRVSVTGSAFQVGSDGGGGVILDSGTTLTYWVETAFNPIVAAFRRQILYPEADGSSYDLTLCYDVSNATASSLTLPAMVVHMTNVDFEIPVSNLFMYVDNSARTVCLAMGASDQFSIIGNIQQQNNLVVHDVVNRRVGFLPFDCATISP